VVNINLITPLEDCVRDVIEIDLLRPRWMRNAACRGEGFCAWFPKDEVGEEADLARTVCSGCSVRPECLDYALAAGIRHGLWGGLSAKERAALTRQRVQQARANGSMRYAGGR
jgi:WhiB family transcriptional regulator, redox-sensing transcriptional regulator